MIVTAWNNGRFHKTGGGYGIRIPKKFRETLFDKKGNYIELQIEDKTLKIDISEYSGLY